MLASNRRTCSDLRNDERGAVMFMGVFMACFLIGSLWFLIGIGDAIVAREKVQEATDNAAFSGAVVHAKGMNIISFLNIALLVMGFIYVVLALIVDVILFVGAVVSIWISFFTFGLGGGAAAATALSWATKVDKVAMLFMKFGKPIMNGMAGVQTASAVIAPLLASRSAYKVGGSYGSGITTVGLSPSMIPGSLAGVNIGAAKDKIEAFKNGPFSASGALGAMQEGLVKAGGERLGLPVRSAEMNLLCKQSIKWVAKKVGELLQYIVPDAAGTAVDYLAKKGGEVLGDVVAALHCAKAGAAKADSWEDWVRQAVSKIPGAGLLYVYQQDNFWGGKTFGGKQPFGPKLMAEGGSNGSSWMMVYAVSGMTPKDSEGGKVSRAAYEFSNSVQAPKTRYYDAQSEFYYDCNGRFRDDQCNGFEKAFPFALYGMRWRGRLVRVKTPVAILSGLASSLAGAALAAGVPEPKSGPSSNLLGWAFGNEASREAQDLIKRVPGYVAPTGGNSSYH
jgi:hypothetical protein